MPGRKNAKVLRKQHRSELEATQKKCTGSNTEEEHRRQHRCALGTTQKKFTGSNPEEVHGRQRRKSAQEATNLQNNKKD